MTHWQSKRTVNLQESPNGVGKSPLERSNWGCKIYSLLKKIEEIQHYEEYFKQSEKSIWFLIFYKIYFKIILYFSIEQYILNLNHLL